MNYTFDSLKKVPNDPHSTCFACGKQNPFGFQLVFHTDEVNLYSKFMTRSEFSGWSNLTHGGILATLLDETMAWTGIYLYKKYILTKSMTITYKKPVLAGTEIFLKGFVEKEVNNREVSIGAEIYNSNEELCASAVGSIILFTKEKFHKLKISSDEFLENFEKNVFQD
jgi:acyl-coenzyme A thioesterase PaaI-like protein